MVVRHKEHQSGRLNRALVSLCQTSSHCRQKQYYRAVGLAKKNNSSCVLGPLEDPNSWEIGGLPVAQLNGTQAGITHYAHSHSFLRSLPFPESLAHLPPTTSSRLFMPGTHHSLNSHLRYSPPFSFYTLFPYDPCHSASPYHPSPPLRRKTKKKDPKKRQQRRKRFLASMRKSKTGRGSEHCQQIIDFQKPPQEAVQS